MDAMQNDSATMTSTTATATVEDPENQAPDAQPTTPAPEATPDAAADQDADRPTDEAADPAADQDTEQSAADRPTAEDVPQPRNAEPAEPASFAESNAGKAKKRKVAPKAKTVAGMKSLVVFREGKVHYADETVVVLDLDDAAHPDTDVHDVVDKLSELRDAIESPGRSEAVALVAELIQTKALA
jgi:hypothetical protein